MAPAIASKKPNGRRERVGNVSNAGCFLADASRKSDKAAPFPQFHRLDLDGRVAILVQDNPESFIAITEQGTWLNPWTKQPFKKLKDCKKSVKYRLQKGFWPGRIEGVPVL